LRDLADQRQADAVGRAALPGGVFGSVGESGKQVRHGLAVDARPVVADRHTDIRAGAVHPQLDHAAAVLVSKGVVHQRRQCPAQRSSGPDDGESP
jgi:hypothetical protein